MRQQAAILLLVYCRPGPMRCTHVLSNLALKVALSMFSGQLLPSLGRFWRARRLPSFSLCNTSPRQVLHLWHF